MKMKFMSSKRETFDPFKSDNREIMTRIDTDEIIEELLQSTTNVVR